MIDTPLVNKNCLLEKFPGKGGWTFARIPEIPMNRDAPFGWVIVSGSIDDFALKSFKLMPMGDGSLFLPVRAEIRKKLKKEAVDTVHVILFEDNSPADVPGEIWYCLGQETDAKKAFERLTDNQRKSYIDWIYSAKKDETRVDRIAEMMKRLVS